MSLTSDPAPRVTTNHGSHRWFIYAILIAMPALMGWADFFSSLAADTTAGSILNRTIPLTYALFAAELSLPFIYVAATRLTPSAPHRATAVKICYFFAATGYILDGATAIATSPAIGYMWVFFLTAVYIPTTTIAAVLLTDSRATATE